MNERKKSYQNYSLKNMEGEKWEDIPVLDGAYRLSNYGRIKSLRREVERARGRNYWTKDRILRTHIRTVPLRNGHGSVQMLCIAISFEKKKISIAIARMVYFLFVKKFKLEDRTVIVRCKDRKAANIYPENLELVTLSTAIEKAYQLKRRARTSFTHDATAVTQYNMQGKWLANFPSVSFAQRKTAINASAILKGMKRAGGYSTGFIWREGVYKKDLTKIPSSIKKREVSSRLLLQTPITRYNFQGRRIAIYPDVKTARLAMKSQTYVITSALKGISYTVKGSVLIAGKGPARMDVTAHLQKRQSKAAKSVWRPVWQLNDNGKKIKEYPSVAAAARDIEVHAMAVHGALKDKKRTSGGFYWQYK